MPTRIHVIRHGESRWNAVGRWQGLADPPLSPRGQAQAAEAAARVAAWPDADRVVSVVTSPLRRARATAAAITRDLGLQRLDVDDRLVERHVGMWTGLTKPQIAERWPHAFESEPWMEPPGAETRAAMAERVLAAMADAAADVGPDGEAILVAHGGVIRSIERACDEPMGSIPNLICVTFEADLTASAGWALVTRHPLVSLDDSNVTMPSAP